MPPPFLPRWSGDGHARFPGRWGKAWTSWASSCSPLCAPSNPRSGSWSELTVLDLWSTYLTYLTPGAWVYCFTASRFDMRYGPSLFLSLRSCLGEVGLFFPSCSSGVPRRVISVLLSCRLWEVRSFSTREDQTFRETAVMCYVKRFDFFSCRAHCGSYSSELLPLYPPAALSSFPYIEKVSGKELTQKIVHSDAIL